jgi:iron transport multicopper oxidase
MLRAIQFTTLVFSLVPYIKAVTIGPVSDLRIGNVEISPDGYSRSYVFC